MTLSKPAPAPRATAILLNIVAQKTDHIAALELQLQAHAHRTAQLQARVLATFDALDALQLAHAAELAAERREHARLRDKLRAHDAALRAAEDERDSMREAVVQLIEKVELTNDYALWPHSSLRATSRIASGKRKPPPEQPDLGPPHLAYAASLLSTLTAERERAHAAHARAQADADAAIARLQAQVARRDAEIERLAGAHRCPHCAAPKEGSAPARLDEPAPVRITKEDAIQILEKSASRNRGLKREVEGLVARLEDVRSAASSPSLSDRPTKPPHLDAPPKFKRKSRSPAERSSGKLTPRPPAELSSGTLTPRPPSRTPLRGDFDTQGRHAAAPSPRTDQVRAAPTAADASQSPNPGPPPPDFPHMLKIEEECLRLHDVERALRAELDAFKRDAHARARRLEDEIARLTAAAPRAAPSFMSDLEEEEDEDDGESMELATPLQPTLILLGSPDPPDVPLPPSPALPDQFDMDTLDLERVRMDLGAAEARLRDKDVEMMRLREDLTDMRHYLYSRSQGG